MSTAIIAVGAETWHVLPDGGEQIVQPARLVDVNAEEFRQLVHDDHEADARLESDEHRIRR